MKLYTAFACAVMALALSAHAAPVRDVIVANPSTQPIPVTVIDSAGGGGQSSRIVFLGYSPGAVSGIGGWRGMNDACPVGRMCSSEEIINSEDLSFEPAIFDSAWVRPSPLAPANGDEAVSFLDASGIVYDGTSTNCTSWTGAGSALILISDDSGFRFSQADDCGLVREVACCGVAP